MATSTYTLQGTTPTTIDATDKIQFAGAGGFDDPITVGEYNDTTHVKSSADANDSSGNGPYNNKFISQTGGTGGDSQADWGGGTEDLDQILASECALKYNFSDASSVAITNHTMYFYDGTTDTTPPSGLDCRLAEQGDTNFTEAEGSGSALSVTDSSSATSHDFYFVPSVSPTSVGLKTGKLKNALTYA